MLVVIQGRTRGGEAPVVLDLLDFISFFEYCDQSSDPENAQNASYEAQST